MWMRPIAAVNVVPRKRWWAVVDGNNVAAAVLNRTSCSGIRIGVAARRSELTGDAADPIFGAGFVRKCNICADASSG